MPAKTETAITTALIDWIVKQGGDAWHVHGNMLQRRGEPDIDGFLPGGFHLKIEVKTPTGTPTALQLKRLRVYKAAGYVAGVVTNLEELVELVEQHGYKQSQSR